MAPSKLRPFYIVVTRYEEPKKRPITHAYGSYEGWTKARATTEKNKIIREFFMENPSKAQYLRVSMLRLIDIELLNKDFNLVTTDSMHNSPQELQGPHQGPSGEVLI